MARHATLTLAYKKYRAQMPITAVGDVPLPDLVVTAVSVSSPLSFGDPMTVDRTTANQGPVDAPAFFVRRVLSVDTVFGHDDVLFAFCDYAAGQPAATNGSCHLTVPYDASAAPGSYHVLAMADSSILVTERNEGNNVTVMPGTVQVQ